MASAVAAGGIQFIEITWKTDKAAELIAELRSEFPTFSIGTGTLLNLEQLQQAIDCGTQFLFTPHTDVIPFFQRYATMFSEFKDC